MTRRERIQWESFKIFRAWEYDTHIVYWRMRPIFEGTLEECEQFRRDHYMDRPPTLIEMVVRNAI